MKLILLTLKLYASMTGTETNIERLQASFSTAACMTEYNESVCASYCLNSAYMGHDIQEELVPVCNEVLELFQGEN